VEAERYLQLIDFFATFELLANNAEINWLLSRMLVSKLCSFDDENSFRYLSTRLGLVKRWVWLDTKLGSLRVADLKLRVLECAVFVKYKPC